MSDISTTVGSIDEYDSAAECVGAIAAKIGELWDAFGGWLDLDDAGDGFCGWDDWATSKPEFLDMLVDSVNGIDESDGVALAIKDGLRVVMCPSGAGGMGVVSEEDCLEWVRLTTERCPGEKVHGYCAFNPNDGLAAIWRKDPKPGGPLLVVVKREAVRRCREQILAMLDGPDGWDKHSNQLVPALRVFHYHPVDDEDSLEDAA